MTDTFISIGQPSHVKEEIAPAGISFMPVIGKKLEGRPTVMTQEVLQKLEWAFAHAFTDKEACLYANIAPSTFYDYCNKNPDFSERKEELKLHPNITAKTILVEKIDGSLDQARWWAERKVSDEFSTKNVTKHEGKIDTGETLSSAAQKELVDKFNADMRAIIVEERRKQS